MSRRWIACAGLLGCLLSGRSYAQDGAPAMVAAGSGKVVETVDSGGYTYVQIDTGSKKFWAASPQFKVAVGDRVSVPGGMEMRDFTSKTLKRTFDVISFVDHVTVESGSPSAGAITKHAGAQGSAGDAKAHTSAAAIGASGIAKAEGGQTVAELYANRAALAGKDVAVRGKVAKFTPNVMGKNWVHLQDGSGAAGTNDVTVTTSATAAVGQTVLVKGKLVTEKDFGAGYKYEVIIEDAALSAEP